MAEHDCLKIKEITEVTESTKRAHIRLDDHKERMDRLEDNNKILHEMNTNIKVMVEQNSYRDEKVDTIEKDVKEIKEKPRQNWDKVKWTVITVLCTSLALFVISQVPNWIAGL